MRTKKLSIMALVAGFVLSSAASVTASPLNASAVDGALEVVSSGTNVSRPCLPVPTGGWLCPDG